MRSISQEIRNVVVFFPAAVLTFNLESNRLLYIGRGMSKMSAPHSFVCFCGAVVLLSKG